MRALVLERKGVLAIRDVGTPQPLGPGEVRIAVHTVGVCGSDVHYYRHGRAGPRIVDAPMIMGHEAAGTVVEVGAGVEGLAVGDRVCMEPGVPDPRSRASKLGKYNVDPKVTFWATPPVHGCLVESVVHPAAFTYKLPDQVSFGEAALIEPFAIGMQAAVKARITPGDVGVVLGAGTIGIMTALAALGSGCSKVFVTDVHRKRLDIAARYPGVVPVDVTSEDGPARVLGETGGWGANVVFEASGSPRAIASLVDYACPGGTIVLIGVPTEPNSLDIAAAINKEVELRTVFRYANVYDRAVNLVASGKVDLKPLISATYAFEDAIQAFERAAEHRADDVKVQIRVASA